MSLCSRYYLQDRQHPLTTRVVIPERTASLGYSALVVTGSPSERKNVFSKTEASTDAACKLSLYNSSFKKSICSPARNFVDDKSIEHVDKEFVNKNKHHM